ncbi:conjugal transfer protein TraH [Escherichia coli]|uniref:conjugal transfer protein TraH n=1 Tax=Escherichia coli TaxID=562 RepID=UPI0022816D54|nr:conjugal transfer protein TraH [Escherichia coli]MCZ0198736.1 conjugal transfer protein TraH [Escherichia coli]
MPRIKPLLVLCAALLTVTPAASADVNSDMNQFFNKLGFASNTTQPGVWQGQAAGYAYGGSLYARTQVKNVQLISMTLPDINAGCGGIDAYLGSFSFINSEQLQRFVKQIMSNAAGYFFDLALQTTVDDKEKGFISSTTIPVFKYLVDPQMLGVSNSMIYQLTDYIGYDILLQYIQELIQQARAMVATGNYDEAVIEHINDNMNDATRQIAAFQSQVQVQQDALLVVDRQMSYMRQQLSARMLSRYQNNYHFGGSTL